LVPSNLCNWLSFFRWALWEAYTASQDLRLLAEFKGDEEKVMEFVSANGANAWVMGGK